MTRPTTTGKAQDLITFTRSTTGTALAKISYGEELVTNGTEWTGASGTTPPTGWTSSGIRPNYAVVDGTLSVNPTSNIWTGYAITGLVIGKSYQITGEYKSGGAGGSVYLRIANSVGANAGDSYFAGDTSSTDWTAEQGTFTPTATTVYVSIGVSQNKFGYFDNVSVKEVFYDQPDGTLQLFNHPINKPRIEYDAEGNCLGLLVEEARTNSQANSENINAAWSQKATGRTEVLSNQITAPDGTSSADLIQAIDGSSAGEQYARRFISSISSTNTLSVFVKKKNWRYIALRLIGNRVFDFDTEAFTMGSGTIQKLPNGWYRLSVTDAAGGTAYIGVGTASSANAIPWATAPQNNEGVYIWGAQLEEGSFPTSYIPTSGSAVTRAADVASLAVSEFGYNQDQGTVVATGSTVSTVGAGKEMINLNDGTNSNYMQLNKTAFTNQTRARFFVITGNTTQAQIFSAVGSVSAGSVNKHAGAFQKNDFAFVFDGSLKGVDTVGEVPPVTTVTLGASATSAQQLNGHIKSVQYYPLRLSNAQLQALTV